MDRENEKSLYAAPASRFREMGHGIETRWAINVTLAVDKSAAAPRLSLALYRILFGASV